MGARIFVSEEMQAILCALALSVYVESASRQTLPVIHRLSQPVTWRCHAIHEAHAL